MVPDAALFIWTSWVYGHYNLGIERTYIEEYDPSTNSVRPVPGHLEYTFTCKYRPMECGTRTQKRKNTGKWGTKNLGRVTERCNEKRGVLNITNTQQGVIEFTQLAFRVLLVLWCAVNRRPFHMLADPLFLMIVHILRPDALVPCPQTISSDLTYLFNRAAIRVHETFQVRAIVFPHLSR